MYSLLIIAEESDGIMELYSGLARKGFACSVIPDGDRAIKRVARDPPDLVLVDIDGSSAGYRAWDLFQKTGSESSPPVIALISKEVLDSPGAELEVDDFAVKPCDVNELALRVRRLLKRTRSIDAGEVIKRGDLVIDLARCEVSLGGRLVELTFREYELLRFLAASKGRVFTREALLNRVWGYDYFGGDRTVDVHIRRLRSKIEDASHTFIETVRNIGYRFKRNI